MDTVTKKVLYKTNISNVSLRVEIGYATQGECIVRIPEQEFKDSVDVASTATKTYDKLSKDILTLGKFFPAPGKSVILIQFVFVENGKEIHREVIEKQTQTFERTSNIFLLELEPPKEK